MTIEEIKDLIDSTITENGKKFITGKALNLALNELVAAVEEAVANAGGGSATERIYYNLDGTALTDEQKAHNASLFTLIKTSLEADELVVPLAIFVNEAGQAFFHVNIVTVGYAEGSVILYGLIDSVVRFVMSEDGTVSIGE